MVIKTLYRRQRFPGRGRTVHFRIRSRAVTKRDVERAKVAHKPCRVTAERKVTAWYMHFERRSHCENLWQAS